MKIFHALCGEGKPYRFPVEHSGPYCYPVFIDQAPLRAHLLLSLVERLFNTIPTQGGGFSVVVGAWQREGHRGSRAPWGAAWVTWPLQRDTSATSGPFVSFQDSHNERHPFLPQRWPDLFSSSSASTHSQFWSLSGFTLHWSWHRCHAIFWLGFYCNHVVFCVVPLAQWKDAFMNQISSAGWQVRWFLRGWQDAPKGCRSALGGWFLPLNLCKQ